MNLWLLGGLMMAVGGGMAVAAWRGRRFGDEPHCRGCGYLLVGLTSDRCPKCGTPISIANTVKGVRHRSGRLAIAGVLLLLIGLGLVVPQVREAFASIDFYQYKTTGWVIDDLASTLPKQHAKAWREIVRRDKAEALTPAQRDRLVELGLKHQLDYVDSGGVGRRDLLTWVVDMARTGRLDEQQRERLFSQAVRASIRVRPEVNAGMPIAYVIQVDILFAAADGSNLWTLREHRSPLWVGEYINAECLGGTTNYLAGITSTSHPSMLDPQGRLPPGEHAIASRPKLTVHYEGELVHTWEPTVEARFTVLPEGEHAAVRLVNSPEIDEQVRSAIRLKKISREADGSVRPVVHIDRLPIDVAMGVFVETSEGERRVGTEIFRTRNFNYVSELVDDLPRGGPVTIILRPDVEAAMKTVDLLEIWGGEMRFEDLVAPGD